ncbi:expressed unknown protein [Seminavis robusta]|uniref:Uncharacterized protein n=1 Tax=Seminavis robusta TaxID=568900 RepID=A0A9N8E2J0_9STRA|nr:expressed unknown protein [Seminavis robusta]|eukprot:Sro553_g165330.1 n/a (252) ;mRNA; r:30737-31492
MNSMNAHCNIEHKGQEVADLHPLVQGILANDRWEHADDDTDADKATTSPHACASRKISPLAALILSKADLGSIKTMYKQNRQALTPELIRNACSNGFSANLEALIGSGNGDESDSDNDNDAEEDAVNSHPIFEALNYPCFGRWELEDIDESQGRFFRDLAWQELHPLDFLIMCKADLRSIQFMYELYPQALTTALLTNTLRHGCQPGVVTFQAGKDPSTVTQLEDCVILAMERDQTLLIGHPKKISACFQT